MISNKCRETEVLLYLIIMGSIEIFHTKNKINNIMDENYTWCSIHYTQTKIVDVYDR